MHHPSEEGRLNPFFLRQPSPAQRHLRRRRVPACGCAPSNRYPRGQLTLSWTLFSLSSLLLRKWMSAGPSRRPPQSSYMEPPRLWASNGSEETAPWIRICLPVTQFLPLPCPGWHPLCSAMFCIGCSGPPRPSNPLWGPLKRSRNLRALLQGMLDPWE
eukprot:EG_transcript_28799